MISLHLLGPPRILMDGVAPPAELLWRKNLALLIYLVRSPRGRSREHLIGILWPDKDDSKARHSLNEALRVLRRSVGSALETEGETITISEVEVDVADLEHVDPAEIGLTFLEGFTVPDAPGFDDWLSAERRSVRGMQLELLGDRAERALAKGASLRARELALTGLRLDPHHEPSAQIAMKAAALEGDRSGAMEIFESLSQSLQEIGIEPGATTRELLLRIRAGRVVRGAGSEAKTAEPRPALAGSAGEILGQLVQGWSSVVHGEGRVVVVFGDPGTGKTRLADEIASRALLDGAVVSRARAIEGEASRETLSALLRGGLDVPELAGAPREALAALATLDPDIALRFSAAKNATALPLAEGLIASIRAIAEEHPVLMLLDDAHHAAPDVLALLESLVERLRDHPVGLFLAGARHQPGIDRIAERIGRDVPGIVALLKPLSELEITELVESTFPSYKPAQRARLARRVLADTAGNPFLAVELIRAVQAGLNLAEDAAAWPSARHTLDDTRPGDLPPSVAAALRLRFRRLSEPAQRALVAVAVLGGRRPVAVLARAAELELPALESALDELEWSRWLSGDARGYGFATSLAREVVLADMVTAGQQRRMQERAREVGGQRPGTVD